MQYLSDKYVVDEKLSLYPKDLQARAKINAFNNWQNMNIRLGGAGTFLSLVGICAQPDHPLTSSVTYFSTDSSKIPHHTTGFLL